MKFWKVNSKNAALDWCRLYCDIVGGVITHFGQVVCHFTT